MSRIMIDTWYCCEFNNTVELCKICRCEQIEDYRWQIITFYDRKNIFYGTIKDCLKWIEENKTDRRYID